ncbi:MAG: heavy metal translocating P-type ATPase metal-binding domain-containing protein, partial [Pseudomonadales bacterium]|nr:heavy metal translocating P-type ATPase metal-binding domain-containing protein [Pseudomonadales bacterium]
MSEPLTRLRCFQCDAPIAQGGGLEVAVGGEKRLVCCPGCKATVQKVQGLDLERFYDYRSHAESQSFSHFDDRQARGYVDFDDCVTPVGGHSRLSIIVPDIRCAACTWLIE